MTDATVVYNEDSITSDLEPEVRNPRAFEL